MDHPPGGNYRRRRATRHAPSGHVALIGCGPGDPELLTIKAVRCIRQADVLIIDRLVNPAVLVHARPDAKRIAVGKTPAGPATPQGKINRLMRQHALAGQRVARLKGGDPLVFGRAGEEMAALAAAGIAVEVIPGITAAHACAARIALPLTVRKKVRHFTIAHLTLALGAGASRPEPDWQPLARGGAAAIYMGIGAAGLLRAKLLAAGCPRDTPVVIVENGTLASELAVATTLAELLNCVRAYRLTGPAVIFLGLAWETSGLAPPDGVRVFRGPKAWSPRGASSLPIGRLASRPAPAAIPLHPMWSSR